MKFVVCLEKQDLGDFANDDVTVGRIYELIDEDAGNGMVRVIDESGEDYLYRNRSDPPFRNAAAWGHCVGG
ncbi:hypothetical protein [uncultured Thiodictyon sp.]|uniref:hypothetical protein n=1 Tax=uncultured Thiodictyon sp. TaxID=1846217 RepID=UPI0025D12840|nr:hypothetical protein [uncultured Thiodictyon sp.]